MELKDNLETYIDEHNAFNSEIVDLEMYLTAFEQLEPLLSGVNRSLKDMVSINAWTTSTLETQYLIYLPMDYEQVHCAKLKFHDGTLCKSHTHNYIELIYVVVGELSLQINGKVCTLKEGDICLVNTNTFHSEYLHAEESFVICLGVDDAFFEQYQLALSSKDYTLGIKKLIDEKRSQYLYINFTQRNSESTRTRMAFETILLELMTDLPGKKRLVIGYVERIVDLLTKEYDFYVAQADKQAFNLVLVESMCEYIEYHYWNCNVREIADRFNYSPDYLTRLFQKEKKLNLSNYIQKIRMQKAVELLKKTEFPIEMISRKVGYNNIGFFYNKFKKWYGITPMEMRNYNKSFTDKD